MNNNQQQQRQQVKLEDKQQQQQQYVEQLQPMFGAKSFSEEQKLKISQMLQEKYPSELVRTKKMKQGERVFAQIGDVVNQANRIFGVGGWSLQVISSARELLEEYENNVIYVSYISHVRVTLQDGVFKDEVGHFSNKMTCRDDREKATHFGNVRKSSISDGVKRALKLFGSSLGNGL
eukprot:gene18056-21562_t